MALPNDERSHAGPGASDSNRDALPALAAAFGSAIRISSVCLEISCVLFPRKTTNRLINNLGKRLPIAFWSKPNHHQLRTRIAWMDRLVTRNPGCEPDWRQYGMRWNFVIRIFLVISVVMPNRPAQAGRAYDVRLQTKARSQPCLQPDCWTKSSLELLLKVHPGKAVRNPLEHFHHIQIIICEHLFNPMALTRLGLDVVFIIVGAIVPFDGLSHQAV